MIKSLMLMLIGVFFFSGCATVNSYSKQGVNYEKKAGDIKTIAVLPIDFKVIQISAGGVREEMDEWSNDAQKMIKDALAANLESRNIKLAFVDENTLKSSHDEEWFSQKGLYQAIAVSVLDHAYKGINGFPDKIDHFDYTMGEDIQKLSKDMNVDGILFIQGFDTQRTTGKVVMDTFIQALAGVYYTYFNTLNMGLVDAKTGDVVWFTTNNLLDPVDFRKSKDVNKLVQCLTKDFLIKK